MTFDSFVTSVTQDEIVAKVTDTILASNVLCLRLMSKGKPWSGEQMRFPIKTSRNTSMGSYEGFDTFTTTKVNTRQRLSFDLRAFYASATLSNMEIAANSGKAQVLQLTKVEMESVQQDMIDQIGTLLYSTGIGNGNKDFLGLGAIVDDATDVGTYGGLARATFTTLNATRTASGGTLTVALMGALYNACAYGSDRPSLGIANETVWGLYEQLLQPTVNANYDAGGFMQVTRDGVTPRGALKGEIGFDSLFFRGMPIVRDEKSTAQTLWFLNEKYLNWYGAKHPSFKAVSLGSETIAGQYDQVPSKNHGFNWSGFKEPTNQDAVTGQFLVYGNLISENPNRHGRLTGISGI